jgi:hypothetical protein
MELAAGNHGCNSNPPDQGRNTNATVVFLAIYSFTVEILDTEDIEGGSKMFW